MKFLNYYYNKKIYNLNNIMSDNRLDTIIIIILALLVAFIIGFNIIQLIDNKLTNININLPSSMVDRIVDKKNINLNIKENSDKKLENTNTKEHFENTTDNSTTKTSISTDVSDDDSIYLSNVPYLIDKTNASDSVKLIENKNSILTQIGKENSSVLTNEDNEKCFTKPIELDAYNQFASLNNNNFNQLLL